MTYILFQTDQSCCGSVSNTIVCVKVLLFRTRMKFYPLKCTKINQTIIIFFDPKFCKFVHI